MRHIDVHTHLMPQCLWKTVDGGDDWYGMRLEAGDGLGFVAGNGKRIFINSPKLRFTPEERIVNMDEEGTDVQVVSIHTPLFPYHWEKGPAVQMSKDVNDEIAGMAKQHPSRFSGLATLPLQDVDASIEELERAVKVLGLKGAEFDMVVNGKTWDEPEFLPLFKAAESMGALLFFHPQPQENLVALERTRKYGLSNSIGVPLEDAILVATLIYGGILEKCPNLRVIVAHGGGPACFGMGRMDHAWKVRSEARANIPKPPSRYQSQLYYDFLTSSEASLRFLINAVGADHVVIGSDWPFVGWDPSPGGWLESLTSLSTEEKEKISFRNLEQMLGI